MTGAPVVVIVGAGFGGLAAARALRGAPVEVLLLDRNNYHLFQPLLYQVATAGLTPGDIAYPVRVIFRSQRNVEFRMTEVVGADLENRSLLTTNGPLRYDYLILALGAETSFFGLRAVEQHGFALKGIPDAVSIRNHVLRSFEQAIQEPEPGRRRELLTIVVAGGGPTGVEMAGAFAELIRFVLARDQRRLDLSEVQVVLVEGAPRILPTFDQTLSHAAARSLERKGVVVRTGVFLEDYDGRQVRLKGGESIPARTLIWAAGVQASRLGEALGVERGRLGRILVEPTLELPGRPGVFVIGDAAHLEEGGRPLPMMAPPAIQMGRTAARNILHRIHDEPPEAFRYRDPGSLATIGRNAAVAHVHGFKFTGFTAWIVWLAVHLIQLIGFRNRLVVLVNWAWEYFRYEKAAYLIGPE
jgi:NADH:quinone reductase (non-electrogenic)